MTAQSRYIPNSFQTPNAQVDDIMHLLSGDEYKLMSFATRHILGWQDTITNRRARISLSMFENGFTTRDGTHYNGCGLSRGAIIDNLKELKKHKVLIAIGKPTKKGQEYELSDSPDIEGLKKRYSDCQESNTKRTAKARKVLQDRSGQSDLPVLSDNTPTGQSDNPPNGIVQLTRSGQSDNTQLNPSLNPQTQEQKPSPEWRDESWYLNRSVDVHEFGTRFPVPQGIDRMRFCIRMNALFYAWRFGLEDNGVQSLKDTDSIWKTNLRDIGKLAQSDVTPYRVYQYVCDQYKQDWWKQGKTLPFTNILDNILNWQPQPATNGNGASQPTHTPDYHKPVTPLAVSKPLTADDIKRIKQEALGNE